jgi:hypothetical protein
MDLYYPEVCSELTWVTIHDQWGYPYKAIEVRIEKEDYKICAHYSKMRWGSTKPGYYGSGCINTPEDPYKAERIGLQGEVAVAKVFPGLAVDIEYKKGGDRTDFLISDYTTDMKTSRCNLSRILITAISEMGHVFDIKDIYLGGYRKREFIEDKLSIIHLVGFTTKERVLTLPIVPAPTWKGDTRTKLHQNYEIYFSRMLSIEKFHKYYVNQLLPKKV